MALWKKTAVFLFLLALSSGPAVAQRVVRVTEPTAIQPAEVAIAINPKNPDNLVGASFQTARPPGPLAASYTYVTMDGGLTWKTMAPQDPQNFIQGDDAVAFSSDGTAYHVHLSFDGIRVERPRRAESGIITSASHDGGLTWAEPVPAINHVNSVTPFEDKPGIVVDNAPASPFKGNVYLAWTRFDVYGSHDPECHTQIYFSRSTDGGKTFSMPFRISDAAGDCIDSDNTVEGAVPAVGPKGEVYVVWAGSQGLVFDKSLDGGLTFGKDKVMGQMPGGWDFPMPGLDRANGMPVTGVDLSAGPRKGTLYVNWVDERNGDLDVFVASSSDGGETWSAPVRVNDDPLKNGKAQFFTWMAVDPVDGSVNTVFYDRRDTEGTLTRLTMARSTDGGRTFVNHKVNLEPFACNETVFFGDYSGITAYNGRVIPIFMHFVDARRLAVSVALFNFKPGTQQTIN
ncbi:MAG TPA: sialidase family protein [Pyrinomonadaceae bacterium]|nr:sialidase family protein [Pyrinomonadaceae bacterium]